MKLIKQLQKTDLRFILLQEHSKLPIEKDWQSTNNYPFDHPSILAHEGNIGVVCGFGNLGVVDIDEEGLYQELFHNFHNFKELEKSTLVTKTSRGRHVYIITPVPLQSTSIVLEKDGKSTTISIQGVGKYVVAPGSIHPSGAKYELVNEQVSDILKVDSDFLEQLKKRISIVACQANYKSNDNTEWDIDSLLQGTGQGNRNLSAFALATFFRKAGMTSDACSGKLIEWNSRNKPPLSQDELNRTVESAYRPEQPYQLRFRQKTKAIAPRVPLGDKWTLTAYSQDKIFMLEIRDENESILTRISNKNKLVLDNSVVKNQLCRELQILGIVTNKDDGLRLVLQAFAKLRAPFFDYIDKLTQPQIEEQILISEEEKAEATKLLQDKRFLIKIVEVKEKYLGHVGEHRNTWLTYLSGTSRNNDNTINEVVKAASAAGKNVFVNAVQNFFPKEIVKVFSRLTPQALYYFREPGALKNKIIILCERAGGESADYSIRTLESEKELTLAIPVKDEATGLMKTEEIKIEGPVVIWETTTKAVLHTENETRIFSIYIDESQEQTRNIFNYDNERILPIPESEVQAALNPFRNAQRLLKAIPVLIPFKACIDFPADQLRARRDRPRFMALIESLTQLFQYQRQKVEINGKEYLIASPLDYATALLLMSPVLQDLVVGIPPKSQELLDAAKAIKEKVREITVRELMKATHWAKSTVHNHIKPLEESGSLAIIESGKGKATIYEIGEPSVHDRPKLSIAQFLKQLTDDKAKIEAGCPSVFQQTGWYDLAKLEQEIRQTLYPLWSLCENAWTVTKLKHQENNLSSAGFEKWWAEGVFCTPVDTHEHPEAPVVEEETIGQESDDSLADHPSDDDLLEFVREKGTDGYPIAKFREKYGSDRLQKLLQEGRLIELPVGTLRVP